MRGVVAGGIITLGLSARAEAQASPYLPLDDIGYAYIDALQARGQLRSLSMLERPYTTAELRTALAEAESTDSRVLQSWRTALMEAIAKYDPRAEGCRVDCEAGMSDLALRGTVGIFATARTSATRELMLADDTDGAYPGAVARFAAQGGPFVAATRILVDNHYKDDPEYSGKINRAIAGRVEDAYLGVRLPWVEIAAGRVARNLGPSTMQGLQIGHYVLTYDHLFARLGSRRFHLLTMLASLDAMPVGDSVANRFMALHRVSGRWGGLEVAVSEAMLFGGVGRRFEPGYLNPLNIYQLTQYNEEASGNVSVGLEASWRGRGAVSLAGQLMIDDFQIDDCELGCREPTSYGLTISAEGLPLIGEQKWFGSYSRVSNLAYRTPSPYETWMSHGIGLGQGRSDHDEVRIGADLAVMTRLSIRTYAAYRRQGQGDYRLPYPPATEYASTPAIHAGIVDRTARLGVDASWNPSRFVEVRGDIGWNRSDDHRHVEGARRSGVEGWVRVALESPWIIGASIRPE